jgi:hypothetical protein
MKFLLFFVSFIFSIIFYTFHWLSKWKDIFWENISNTFPLLSFSWNLLIESFIFIFIGIIFLYLFSDFKNKGSIKLESYKTEIIYFLFYIFFIFYIYFLNSTININLIIIIISFILSDILFNHLSNISSLIKYKSKFRYLWLIINYIATWLSVFYIYKNWVNFIPLAILIFNITFNILVHKKYTNYISLLISILIILFLLYSLFFSLFELYILYI